jgi:hypothetical protein
MDVLDQTALAAGLAWASGIRLYAVLFFAGLMQRFGLLQLPGALEVLAHPWVLGASGFMLVAEFFADKVPVVDSAWDAVHTFIRIPAGAVLAAASLGHADPVWVALAAILGGSIAAGSHAAKAGGRAVINTSPEPVSNWTASVGEDLLVPAGLLMAVKLPFVFLALLALFLLGVLWMLPKLVRGVGQAFRRLRGEAR